MYVHIIVVITCRGRAVTNVDRTCGPTPLLAIYAIKYVYTISLVPSNAYTILYFGKASANFPGYISGKLS